MNHIETMKLALDALILWEDEAPHAWGQSDENAVEALRQAIDKAKHKQGCNHCNHELYAGTKCKNCGRVTEQPEQSQPVAWMHTNATGHVYFRKKPQDKALNPTPLYTSPPQRKPLPKKDLLRIIDMQQAYDKSGLPMFYRDQMLNVCRSVEQAHGIKE